MGGDSVSEAAAPKQDKATAVLVYEQVKMQWDDQVEYAETLRDRRKTGSSLLAVLVGIGIVRFQLYVKKDETLVLAGAGLYLLRVLMTMSSSCFIFGAYFLFVERSICRRRTWQLADWILRRITYFYRLARVLDPAETAAITVKPTKVPPQRERASKILVPDDEELEKWEAVSEVEVIQERTWRLQQAYRSLEGQNRTVSGRIRNGVIILFAGFVLAFVAFLVYIWSIGEV